MKDAATSRLGGPDAREGSHIAYLYANAHDMAATVVPYLAAGLNNNEKCIWVTSELSAPDVTASLGRLVQDCAGRIRRGQLEIVLTSGLATHWTKDGRAELWLDQLQTALAIGFGGLRLALDASSREAGRRAELQDHERVLAAIVRSRPLRALCGYRLAQCNTAVLACACAHHDRLFAGGKMLTPTERGALPSDELTIAVGVPAHELRTPLQILNAGIETGLVVPEAGARDRVRRALHSIGRVATDLEDALSVRGQALEITPVATELGAVCRRVVSDLLEIDSRLRIVVAAADPVCGTWDEARLEQMIANLVLNAVRHGREPISVVARREAEHAVLEVVDAGGRDSPVDVSRFFGAFDKSGEQAGLGLGLFVVKMIANAHGGDVDAASSPGCTTTMRVRLPLRHPRTAAPSADEHRD